MKDETLQRLAESLTAHEVGVIPYLPYLLQDLWALGTPPHVVTELVRCYAQSGEIGSALDLACGKGAVAIELAKSLNIRVLGVDLMPEFIEEARKLAALHGVIRQADFKLMDVKEAVGQFSGFDLTIWGAAGDLFASKDELLFSLSKTVRYGGYIVIDDAYVSDQRDNAALAFAHAYLTKEEWLSLFSRHNLAVLACRDEQDMVPHAQMEQDLRHIEARVQELALKHPEKRALFFDYLQNQRDETDDLSGSLKGVIWLLRKT